MRFSLAVSHTPWVPERVESWRRLREELACQSVFAELAAYRVFDERAPNHVWSLQMWTWAAERDAEWCVFLQDDAMVSPCFLEELQGICEGNACDVIGLQVASPLAVPLAEAGYPGFTTSDGLVGVGYAIRREALHCFLEWREENLESGAVETISEDSLIGLWAAVTGNRIYHPIPTIVDHDVSLQSTFNNDHHTNRRSRVRWDTYTGDNWEDTRSEIPHMGRFYESTHHLAKRFVTGFSQSEFLAMRSDNGAFEKRKLHYARMARGAEPKAKVFIATPCRGDVNSQYAASVWRLLKDADLDVESSLEIADVQQWSEDLVRIRSRFVSYFLTQTDATHLLFLDADIEMLPKVLKGMLAAGKDFVAAPYPKRDAVDFQRVRAFPEAPPEALAYRYPVRLLGDTLSVGADGCAEVESMPLGCALISREALQAMSAYYEEELGFDDGKHGPSVALFQLFLHDRGLLSEDYSFCARWRNHRSAYARGAGKVWMYLGDGSPVTHHGEHRYAGCVEAFGLKRAH